MANWLRKISGLLRQIKVFGPSVLRYHAAAVFGGGSLKLRLARIGDVRLRPRDSDLRTFSQVFVAKQYDLSGSQHHSAIIANYRDLIAQGRVPVIIDAGANVGAGAIWFAASFPEARVIAIEPDRETARICRENIAGFPKIELIEAGIASRPGRMDVTGAEESWGTQTTRNDDAGAVQAVTVREIIDRAGSEASLFMVKVDIEGFEADLFASNTEWVDETKVIFVEPHDWLFPGKGTSETMQKRLFGVGFDILLKDENIVFVRPAAETALYGAGHDAMKAVIHERV